MRLRGFSAWGIQTGPFAADLANFVLQNFRLLTFILGECQFLITPEAENEEKGSTQNWITQRGFSAWGIQTGPFAAD